MHSVRPLGCSVYVSSTQGMQVVLLLSLQCLTTLVPKANKTISSCVNQANIFNAFIQRLQKQVIMQDKCTRYVCGFYMLHTPPLEIKGKRLRTRLPDPKSSISAQHSNSVDRNNLITHTPPLSAVSLVQSCLDSVYGHGTVDRCVCPHCDQSGSWPFKRCSSEYCSSS